MQFKSILLFTAAPVALFAAAPAFAQSTGTAAGTTVNNTATLSYSSGGVTQPAVTSNTATFLVDRRIDLVVAESGGTATQVVGGQLQQATTFTVTNNTNATIDIGLNPTNMAGGTAPFGGTDNFNVTNLSVYVDTNGNGSYTPGTDQLVTYLDEMVAGQTRTVFIVADVPTGQANGSVAGVVLTGTADEGGTSGSVGAVVAQTAGADNPGAVDTVFGDAAGSDDAARDGKHSSRDQYNVVSPTITFTKKVRVVSDPQNGTTNPKAIPGAVLEYCLIVENTGAGAATSVAIDDPVPVQTTYVTSSGLAGGQTTGAGATLTCDITPANGGSAAGTSYTAGDTTFHATIASIAAGQALTARFQVTVK